MIVVSTHSDPDQKSRAEGKSFAVQQINIGGNNVTKFRVEAPAGMPALVLAEHFDVTDGTLPESWVFSQGLRGSYGLGPAAWQEPGFWEQWMDDEPTALESYATFRRAL